MSGKNKRLCNV